MLFAGAVGIAIIGAPAEARNERGEPDVRITAATRRGRSHRGAPIGCFVRATSVWTYSRTGHRATRRRSLRQAEGPGPGSCSTSPSARPRSSISAATRLRDGLLRQPRKYAARLEARIEGGETVASVARPRMQVRKRLFVLSRRRMARSVRVLSQRDDRGGELVVFVKAVKSPKFGKLRKYHLGREATRAELALSTRSGDEEQKPRLGRQLPPAFRVDVPDDNVGNGSSIRSIMKPLSARACEIAPSGRCQ